MCSLRSIFCGLGASKKTVDEKTKLIDDKNKASKPEQFRYYPTYSPFAVYPHKFYVPVDVQMQDLPKQSSQKSPKKR